MLRPIDEAELTQAVRRLCNQSLFLHMEVAPGGLLRNLRVELDEVVLRRHESTFNLALRCRGNGWVILEGLTHMAIQEEGHAPRTMPPGGAPLLLCRLEDEDRLTRAIQISKEAFPA